MCLCDCRRSFTSLPTSPGEVPSLRIPSVQESSASKPELSRMHDYMRNARVGVT